MKKLLCIACLFVGMNAAECQQIYLETGKTISSFEYKNSQGNTLENLQATNHTFLRLGYRRSFFTKNFYLSLTGNYSGYGAIGSDRALDNYYEWEMSYLGLGLGIDYEFYHPGNFSFYIKGAASVDFIIQGTQTINEQVYKLPGEEDFKSPLYFYGGGLGIQYKLSEKFAVFTQYLYQRGARFKNEQGKLKINAHHFGIGLIVKISKKHEPAVEMESAQVEQLKKELETNTQKIEELEVIASQVEVLEQVIQVKEEEIKVQEEKINELKESISSALIPYTDRGLTIDERDGKVYVIMENDMLFHSGSWNISPDGEKAVNALGNVLAENPDVSILIEGHTDNATYKGSGHINSNWDLSTKRATAIVEILRKNKDIIPKNLIAAGRGEYDPIADNTSAEGKAKNRRVEVILTPKLDEVYEIIKN